MQHRLIVMWAPPRSLSTAFVRVIAARGDFNVVHEPLCDLSACGEYKHPQQENSSPPLNSPTALFDYIQTLRSHSAVFIKDTCEFDYRHLLAGTPYLREAQHVFMLRNPEKVINSHYHVNPQLTCNEVGYQNLAQLYDSVKAESIHAPCLLMRTTCSIIQTLRYRISAVRPTCSIYPQPCSGRVGTWMSGREPGIGIWMLPTAHVSRLSKGNTARVSTTTQCSMSSTWKTCRITNT